MSAASNSSNSQLAAPQAVPTSATSATKPVLKGQVYLTIALIGAGYAACLLTGFGTFLDSIGPYHLRALPLFLYAALLLITLQAQIVVETGKARKKTAQTQDESSSIPPARIVFTWIVTLLALVYALWAFFLNGPSNPFTFAATYLVLNILAWVGFLVDFFQPQAGITRHAMGRTQSEASAASFATKTADGLVTLPQLLWASRAGGLAVFCLLAALVLHVLANGLTLPLGIAFKPYVAVPITWFPLHRVMYLQVLDLAIGFLASFVALVLLGFVGALEANRQPASSMVGLGKHVVGLAFRLGSRSFQFAVSPLIWVVPAFCIAYFAQRAALYFDIAAHTHSTNPWDFFNPGSVMNTTYFLSGLGDLALAVAAIASVVFAVAAYEYDASIIRQALSLVAAACRIFMYLLPVLFLSLIVLNVALVLVFGVPWPFQLIVAFLVTTALAVGFLLVSPLFGKPGQQPSAGA